MVVKKLSYLKIKSISLLSDKNSEQIEKVQEIAPRLSLNIITLNHALQYHLFTAFPVHTPTSFRQSRRNRRLGPLLQAFHRLAAVPPCLYAQITGKDSLREIIANFSNMLGKFSAKHGNHRIENKGF